MAEESPEVMVLEKESASVPLTPCIAEGSILAGTSRREDPAVFGVDKEPSLALTSVGNDSPM